MRWSRVWTTLAAAAIVVVGLVPAVAVAAPRTGVEATSSPSPGDTAAQAATSITLAHVPPGAVTGVTATGSVSGDHPGTLAPLADGSGVVFDPATDFREGESVTVSVSGAAVVKATGPSYTFTVATAGAPLDPASFSDVTQGGQSAAAAVPGSCTATPTTYVSRPDFGAVPGACTTGDPAAAGGDKILATSDRGAAMYDATGNLVWFGKQDNGTLRYNLQRQMLNGQPVLTYYQGTSSLVPGSGVGEFHVLDQNYNPIHTIRAGNGLRADVHELTFTPDGHALIGSYNPILADVSGVGGLPFQPVIDYVIQEVDVDTGQVYFEWHAVDHVGYRDSHFPLQPLVPWDFFHGNAIEKTADGNYILSARNTWATYKINATSGALIWTLGGRSSDFGPLQAGTGVNPAEGAQPFCWQHFFREHPENGTYSLFDNGSAVGLPDQTCGPARGLVMTLVPPTGGKPGTATLTKVFRHQPDLFSLFAGNMETRGDGGAFVGFGSPPTATLFGADTTARLDVTLSKDSYRTLLAPWAATPSERPTTVVSGGNAYASWNGATGVAAWQLYAGQAGAELSVGSPVSSQGFETKLPLGDAAGAAAVVAIPLDKTGSPLVASPTGLQGSTFIAGLGSTAPVTGAADYSGGLALTLPPVDANFLLLGFVPVRATLAFEPSQSIPVSATFSPAGSRISFQASLRAADLTVDIFSLSALLGPSCRTNAPVTFTLTSPGDASKGSPLTGTYTIPPFTGCAGTDAGLTAVLSRAGNTIDLTLPTP